LGQNALGQVNKTDSLFDVFKQNIEFERKENNGIIIWDDETKLSYLYIIQNCSNETLKKYTNDLDAAVRYYMFTGLTFKAIDSNELKTLLLSHLNDTAKFSFASSCTVFIDAKVIDEMTMAYESFRKNTDNSYIDYTKTEIARIQAKPHLIINGLHHKVISKDDILKLASLVLSDKSLRIVSFTIQFGKKTIKNPSNIISDRIKRNFAKLKSGDDICINEIKAEFENSTRQIRSIYLKIK
jgi:paraquat-inducible protein B